MLVSSCKELLIHMPYQAEVIFAVAQLINTMSLKPARIDTIMSLQDTMSIYSHVNNITCNLTMEGLKHLWWALSCLSVRGGRADLLRLVLANLFQSLRILNFMFFSYVLVI